jgi:hypothetical protein
MNYTSLKNICLNHKGKSAPKDKTEESLAATWGPS